MRNTDYYISFFFFLIDFEEKKICLNITNSTRKGRIKKFQSFQEIYLEIHRLVRAFFFEL